jgi:hypothetical protein
MARRVRLDYRSGFVIGLPFVCCQVAFLGTHCALLEAPCPQTNQTTAPYNAHRTGLYAFRWRGIVPANPGRTLQGPLGYPEKEPLVAVISFSSPARQTDNYEDDGIA